MMERKESVLQYRGSCKTDSIFITVESVRQGTRNERWFPAFLLI